MTCWTASCSRLRSLCSRISSAALSVVPWPVMQMWIFLAFVLLVIVFSGGCSRTVLVSEASPVRIGPAVTGKVYALVDGEWTLSPNRVELPEGWYLVPPSYVEGPHP